MRLPLSCTQYFWTSEELIAPLLAALLAPLLAPCRRASATRVSARPPALMPAVSEQQQSDPRLLAKVYDDMAEKFCQHGLNLPAVVAMRQYFENLEGPGELPAGWVAAWCGLSEGGGGGSCVDRITGRAEWVPSRR